ncbi:helix-turn-helix domain-containing protein [Bifidobacterium castoris]|uniref:Transposase n=1 Tax=Bifidobacterium castoris TaxID=2306972 RepID=A0A430F591_9BIFI|nr:helix-turn-helix domain-containing protein [Bifidobacterium castoris]RSX46103.1 hypothetical protein D2E22_1675 [Bifidobacterium castoris]
MVSAHKTEMILKWHADGVTVTRTASLLGVSEAEVKDVIRTGGKPATTKPEPPAFSDVPLFDDQP